MTGKTEKTLLQAAILLACCVPLMAGGAGILLATGPFSAQPDAVLGNHFRYLSGLLFAIGLGFVSTIPKIETMTARVRLLTFLVVVGGAGRLAGLWMGDDPNLQSLAALGMELLVTPTLCLWQARIAKATGQT